MPKPIEDYIKETLGDLVLNLVKARWERDAALEQVADLQKQLADMQPQP